MALTTTFNSLTEKFWGSKQIADIVGRGHPILAWRMTSPSRQTRGGRTAYAAG